MAGPRWGRPRCGRRSSIACATNSTGAISSGRLVAAAPFDHLVQLPRCQVADFVEIEADAGNRRFRVEADHQFIAGAHDRHLVGHAGLVLAGRRRSDNEPTRRDTRTARSAAARRPATAANWPGTSSKSSACRRNSAMCSGPYRETPLSGGRRPKPRRLELRRTIVPVSQEGKLPQSAGDHVPGRHPSGQLDIVQHRGHPADGRVQPDVDHRHSRGLGPGGQPGSGPGNHPIVGRFRTAGTQALGRVQVDGAFPVAVLAGIAPGAGKNLLGCMPQGPLEIDHNGHAVTGKS